MAGDVLCGWYRKRRDPGLIEGRYEVIGTAVDCEHIDRTVVYRHESGPQWHTASRPYFVAHWQRVRNGVPPAKAGW